MIKTLLLSGLFALGVVGAPPAPAPAPAPAAPVKPYTNPMLPGYHPDPSCTQVKGTFYCITSTFNTFPGLPIYASKDLVNWRHVSNVVHSQDQIPEYSQLKSMQDGIYAPSLRYHNGKFYVIVSFMNVPGYATPLQLIFSSTNPLEPKSWGMPVRWFNPQGAFDPDLFWDDDGQAYVTVHVFDIVGVNQYPIDVNTGKFGASYNLWNGTGGVWPEGPHMYRKDGYYYLMIAEGGTAEDHMVTIARSKSLKGPYQAYEKNPILTNRNTTQYFQAVGHADLFQDTAGNWWGVALSIREGNVAGATPMGRETVLYPVTWNKGEWPQPAPVRGSMSGPLPPTSRQISGNGPWMRDDEEYNFKGKELPLHFAHFRFPPKNFYEITKGKLKINLGKSNLTGPLDFDPTRETDRIPYVGRRQTDTLFTFGVDMEFAPTKEGEEAGISLFLNQYQHADLGIAVVNGTVQVRHRETSFGTDAWKGFPGHFENLITLPSSLKGKPVRLQLQAISDSEYEISFGPVGKGAKLQKAGVVKASLVSGGRGQFVGSFVGVYGTANGGDGKTPAYFGNWSYRGQAQKIDHNTIVKS